MGTHCVTRRRRDVLLLLVLSACLARVAAAAQTSSAVGAIGSFASGSLDASHTFGYEVQLWRMNERVVGLLIVSHGTGGEPPIGVLDGVTFNAVTGEIAFNAQLRVDMGEQCRRFHFVGRLREAELVGTLEATPRLQSPDASIQSLALARTAAPLRSFQTYAEWKHDAEDRVRLHGACP